MALPMSGRLAARDLNLSWSASSLGCHHVLPRPSAAFLYSASRVTSPIAGVVRHA